MLPQAATEDDVRVPHVPGQAAEQEARLGPPPGPQPLPPLPRHLQPFSPALSPSTALPPGQAPSSPSLEGRSVAQAGLARELQRAVEGIEHSFHAPCW